MCHEENITNRVQRSPADAAENIYIIAYMREIRSSRSLNPEAYGGYGGRLLVRMCSLQS